MSALHSLNPKAEQARRGQALEINIGAAEAIAQVLEPNFGPTGLYKLLVGGAGDLRVSKDGAVLLDELPIAHPSAALISRTAIAIDDVVGDATTQTVLLIGDLLRQARRWLQEGVHPRAICAGYELAKVQAIKFLDSVVVSLPETQKYDTQLLERAAYSVLNTKVNTNLAHELSEICVKAVLTAARSEGEKHLIDLSMVEIMTMQEELDQNSQFINGIVMDHGWRYDEMKCNRFENCFILTLNVTLEYEKSEVNSQYFYKSAEERVKQAEIERSYIDERVDKIIALKKRVCVSKDQSFVVLNMKGVDEISLQKLAENGIMALRRVKRRNLERLTLACGGVCLNTLDNLTEQSLGHAGQVYEKQLGEEKFTFVEDVKMKKSCTILLKGPNKHTILMLKDAIRDGLRAVKNLMTELKYVNGACCFESQLYTNLVAYSDTVQGKERLGVQAFADAILQLPKTIVKNSGYDAQECVLKLVDANKAGNFGFDINTGLPIASEELNIMDGYVLKSQVIHSATTISCEMLLVDEILKAGRSLSGGAETEQDAAE